MENRLYLHVPKFEELIYRQKIMNDPETMDYNRGYDEYDGYNKYTGCIDFPEDKWEKWYSWMVDNKPECYYAYIVRRDDNKFIGDVSIHFNKSKKWYEMGILIEAKYRGMGYAEEAISLLMDIAFNEYDALVVHNYFEEVRKAAYKMHINAGFKLIDASNGIYNLILTKEDWQKK